MNRLKITEISKKNIQNTQGKSKDDFKNRELYDLVTSKDSYVIIGPRRIGKTTLLEEIVNHYKDEIILFLRLDSAEFHVLDSAQKNEFAINLRDLIKDENIKILLLDEIQNLEKWNYVLKDIKDTCPEVKIIATGSDSNALMIANEIGVGRFKTLFYGVLTMNEVKKTIQNITLDEYINYKHFPIYNNDDYIVEVREAIVEKSISSSISNKVSFYRMFKEISNNPGQEVNLEKMSSTMGISRQYVNNYLALAMSGQVLFALQNTKTNINKKIYSLIPGAFRIFDSSNSFEKLPDTQKGAHFENFVFIQLLAKTRKFSERAIWSYLRDNKFKGGRNEIDFVYQNTAIEVKFSTDIQKIESYVDLAKANHIKYLYFVYLGQTTEAINIHGIEVQLLNYNDISQISLK